MFGNHGASYKVFVSLLFLATGWPAEAVDYGVRAKGEKYSGTVALARSIGDGSQGPWQIYCSGQMIAPRWLLTAAHCLQEQADRPSTSELRAFSRRLRVHFGEGAEGGEVKESLYTVKRALIHPDYLREIRGHSDIALLELEEDAPLNAHAYPRLGIGAEFLRERLRRLSFLTVSGFGYSEQLLEGERRPREIFGIRHAGEIRLEARHGSEILIVGGRSHTNLGEPAPRDGDSGGPAFYIDPQGDFWLAGLVSRATRHAHGPYGSVLTLVQDSICWIERETEIVFRRVDAGRFLCDQRSLPFDSEILRRGDFQSYCESTSLSAAARHTLSTLAEILETQGCAELAEKLQSSTNLSLDALQIIDLTPLSFFPNLERLSLRENLIDSVAAIAGLPALRFVDISFNNIQDYSLFESHPNSDLWVVGSARQQWNLPRTEFIRICSDPKRHVGPAWRTVQEILKQLELREHQCVNGNYELIRQRSWEFWRARGLEDFSPFIGVDTLESLNLSGQKARSLDFLLGIKNLRRLVLDGNTEISDFSPLLSLEYLRELSLREMNLSNIDMFLPMRRLRSLQISGNRIRDFSQWQIREERGFELFGKETQIPD